MATVGFASTDGDPSHAWLGTFWFLSMLAKFFKRGYYRIPASTLRLDSETPSQAQIWQITTTTEKGQPSREEIGASLPFRSRDI